jgi:hypothetical protein
MLARRAYLGYNEQANGFVQRDPSGKPVRSHEPLTTRATWEAAQHAPAPIGPPLNYPLSNVLTCAACGGGLTGARGGRGEKRVYRCKCGAGPTILADPVESYVVEKLRERPRHVYVPAVEGEDTSEIEALLAEAEVEADEFAADRTARKILGDRYHAALQSRVDEVARLSRELAEVARPAREEFFPEVPPDMITVEHSPPFARAAWESMTVRRGRGTVEERLTLTPRQF